MRVTWHCRECGAYFEGSWMSKGCACGNTKFSNEVLVDGRMLRSMKVTGASLIVPARQGYIFEEEVFQHPKTAQRV